MHDRTLLVGSSQPPVALEAVDTVAAGWVDIAAVESVDIAAAVPDTEHAESGDNVSAGD